MDTSEIHSLPMSEAVSSSPVFFHWNLCGFSVTDLTLVKRKLRTIPNNSRRPVFSFRGEQIRRVEDPDEVRLRRNEEASQQTTSRGSSLVSDNPNTSRDCQKYYGALTETDE